MRAIFTRLTRTISPVLLLSSLAAAEPKDVVLDVVDVDFYATTVSKRDGRSSRDEIGSLVLTADLAGNRIRQFQAEVILEGSTYADFTATVDDLRGKKVPIKASGVSIGELEGVQMNADGEGVLRFTPRSSLVGPGLPASVDLNLKRVGPLKKWLVMYQSKPLRGVQFDLSKNPLSMSTLSLMMSPPKLTKMTTSFLGCNDGGVATALLVYRAPELLEKCDFGRLSADEAGAVLGSVFWKANVYENYYVNGKDPAELQALVRWSLETLKTRGLNLESYRAGGFGRLQEMLVSAVRSGQEEAMREFITLGLVPDSSETMKTALLNLFQIEGKTRRLVESAQARRVLDLVRPSAKKPVAADVLHSLFNYRGSLTLDADADANGRETSRYFEFTRRLIVVMAEEKLDFSAKETGFETFTAAALIRDLTEGTPGVYDPYFTPAQGQELLNLIRAAGGR